MAVALGHLLPPARAVAVAMQHGSVPALLRVLTDPGKGVRQREEALVMTVGSGGGGIGAKKAASVGKTSSKAVHDFFTQVNPEATCRPEKA